jgi:uncharacterized membrane protein YGL010W
MNAFFKRQLAVYADYHRDPRNCLTHYFGIPAIFLGVILPLALWRVPVGPFAPSLALVLVMPAMIGWMVLDIGVGVAMLAAIVPLVSAAEIVARFGDTAMVWFVAAGLFLIGWTLQIVGHSAFERRRPAFVDNLSQMFIGPMFMVAKALVALGLRSDLATSMHGATSAGTGREEWHAEVVAGHHGRDDGGPVFRADGGAGCGAGG